MMNRNTILSILIVIFFLCIRISYNGTPSASFFTIFTSIIFRAIEKGWDYYNFDLTKNYNYYVIEFLIVSLLLILSSNFKKNILILVSLALFVLMWFIWLHMIKYLIQVDLYVKTSIPFLISSILMFILIFSKPPADASRNNDKG